MMPRQVVTDSSGNSYLQIAGVRMGFAQVGVTFNPEEVLSKARLGSFNVAGGKVQFLVIDPISLYREKQALSQKRNSPNDRAHFLVLKEF